ncbi:MAG: RhuM family protein [Ginsengibacter sp.]
MSETIIYEAENQMRVEVIYEEDSLWLNLNQISELFERDKSVISRHIKNIYKEHELKEYATVAKNATVQMEGDRQVTRDIEYFNLDLILAVGYRVSSYKGTQFRIWANRILTEYLVKGYAINEKRLAQKEKEVQILKNGIQILSRAPRKKRCESVFSF